MKKVLFVVLLSSSLFAELMMVSINGRTLLKGVEPVTMFSSSEVIPYEIYIEDKSKCQKYNILSMSDQKNGHLKILIDCLDK